ncbi:MAG: D-alanyl-D-alanine carboxypeptidase, partial [Spirosoma sp.]|nr:D-alanyl-D-alanine carboxypeptidase [Spirosoma sp.]
QAIKGIRRNEFSNQFTAPAKPDADGQDVPFRWSAEVVAQLLTDTLHRSVGVVRLPMPPTARLLRGTPTDSLYKRMLVVSDNLFAEQVHFMTAAERASVQLDPAGERKRLMDSVLHYPAMSAKWADGSGLSRYNLFTPNILVDLLKKLADRVPQKRLFALLPVAGRSGTLRSINLPGEPYIFAKSGSMSGVYNLSGYMLTKKGKVLYFSVMNNNFTGPVSATRKQTGELLKQIHEQF